MKLALGPVLVVVAAGCSVKEVPSKDSTLVVQNEVLADVSADQTLLAAYSSPALAGPGPLGGTLVVRPLPSGDPVFETPGAFGATFGLQGTTLFYFKNATASIDAGPSAAPVDYGQAWVWSAAAGTGVPLTAGFVTLWDAAPDHSTALFVESPTALAGSPSTIRLFRAADCVGGQCPTTVVAQSVDVVRMALSPDGSTAAYQEEIPNADGSRIENVWLVSTADGTAKNVATTGVAAAVPTGDLFSFSPDGSMLGVVTTTGNGPLQLQVVSTVTGDPVPWRPQPADLFCTQIGFADAQSLYVAAVDSMQVASIWKTTVDSASFFITGSAFAVSHSAPGTERYLTFTTASASAVAAGSPRDLSLVDLAAPTVVPVPLTTMGSGTLTVSDDATSAFTFEGFEPGNRLGTLLQVSLPEGKTNTIGRNVYAGGVSFARGLPKLLYFPTPDVRKASGQSLVEWDGSGTELEGFAINYVSVTNPPTLYWTLADPRGLYRRPLP